MVSLTSFLTIVLIWPSPLVLSLTNQENGGAIRRLHSVTETDYYEGTISELSLDKSSHRSNVAEIDNDQYVQSSIDICKGAMSTFPLTKTDRNHVDGIHPQENSDTDATLQYRLLSGLEKGVSKLFCLASLDFSGSCTDLQYVFKNH